MWKTLHGWFEKHRKRFDAGATRWDSKAVFDLLSEKSEPSLADPKVEGAAAALSGPAFWFEQGKDEKGRWQDWADRWSSDPALAVDAIVHASSFYRETDDTSAILEPRPFAEGIDSLEAPAFVRLRDIFMNASPKGYAAASARAKQRLANASDAERIVLAFFFPKEDFLGKAKDWAMHLSEEDESYGYTLPMLYTLALLKDKELEQYTNTGTWELARKGSKRLATHGDAAAPVFRFLWVTMYGSDIAEPLGKALGTLETESTAGIFVEQLDNHHKGAIARPWLKAHPDLALPALTNLVAKGKAGAAARALLDSMELTKHGQPLPDATLDELPNVLREPPWRKPKTAAKKTAHEPPVLEMLSYEERIDWGDDDPGEAKAYEFDGDQKPTKANDEKVEKKLRAEIKKDGYTFLMGLAEMTAPKTLEIWNTWPAEHFYVQERSLLAFLARFGIDALPGCIAHAQRKADVLPGLAKVDSPRVAPLMAHAFVNLKKRKDDGAAWLERFPRAAIIGLLPELAKRTPKERATIEEAIRFVARENSQTVRDVAKEYGALPTLDSILQSSKFMAAAKMPKLGSFFTPKGLPRPTLLGGQKVLPLEALTDLASYLALSKRGDFHPALYDIKSACDPKSLARFAWALFYEWLSSGAPMKEDWGFFVLAIFGDEEAARALQPMVKEWAPGGFPQRAQLGIDVLASMGSQAALRAIYVTATKVRSRALAAHAEEMLQKVAAKLKMSRDDLADRLVPDLDLDKKGQRTFSYGKRVFVARFDEDLSLGLYAGNQKIKDLPKETSADDESEVYEAQRDWKELKKKAREVVAEQVKRLEQALISRRKWDQAAFVERFKDHALMRQLARRLVWGAYKNDAFVSAFCVAEDGSLADADDRPLKLPEGATVGLVHPLEIDAKMRATFGDRLADYKMAQPFEQLVRATYVLEGAEKKKPALERFAGKKVPPTKVLGLERRGWRRGKSGDGGNISDYDKAAGGFNANLLLDPGFYAGEPKESEDQSLEAVTFSRGGKAITLGDADAILVSEVIRDLTAITSSAT